MGRAGNHSSQIKESKRLLKTLKKIMGYFIYWFILVAFGSALLSNKELKIKLTANLHISTLYLRGNFWFHEILEFRYF